MTLSKKDAYLVAISGGPDSVFLLHWLLNHGYKKLILGHVNYHWRKNSDEDQKIVESLAHKFKLPLEVKSLQSHQEKPKQENFEAWARNQRYNFFSELGKKYQTSNLVVGHQENDLIETFILQQARNGVVKYFGLPQVTTHHHLQIWRPLLAHKKSEILQWLKEHQIQYASDQTNSDLRLQRNRIRQQLNENEFPQIKAQIVLKNQQNQTKNGAIEIYLKKHQKQESLFLIGDIKNWDEQLVQRLIYLFFQKQGLEKHLIGRKKQLLNEISKRLTQSDKSFWLIKLDDQLLIKDYDWLHLLSVKELPNDSIILKSSKDFQKLQPFENKTQIIETIQQDEHQFPYEIRTLNPTQIKGWKWGQKSLQILLGKAKFSYKKRFKTGIIYSLKHQRFLDKWRW